jgi:hypothetical protein
LKRLEGDAVITKKLTPGEITSTVEKIRKRYDEFIMKFFKPKSLRKAFEARYIAALRAKVDVSSFLIAEISAIEELVKREEQRVMAGPMRPAAAQREPDFADRVLEENHRRIEKYADIPFHADAGEEVRRLLGALTDLERARWQDIGTALQDTMYAPSSSEMLALDSELRFLASSSRDETPPSLSRLIGQLRQFPRNYPAIDREEKDYVLAAAFFLNDLHQVLERVKRVYTEMSEEDMGILYDSIAWVWGVISDFRLKDLKRKNRSDREGKRA